MYNLPDLIITRHGRCVHNSKESEFLWKRYSNDDIMGMTLEGIQETARKAKELARVLHRDQEVILLYTSSVRSAQTASLIQSELIRMHGFINVVMDKVSIFDEIPRPTLEKPMPPDFDFEIFKKDVNYNLGGETFHQRARGYSEWLADGQKEWFKERMPTENSQMVLVGHHYALSAFLAALVVNSTEKIEGIEEPAMDIYNAAHQFYLEHDEFFYVSHLMAQTNETVSPRFKNLADYASYRLSHSVCRFAGVQFKKRGDVVPV